jgi:hypothetical protein
MKTTTLLLAVALATAAPATAQQTSPISFARGASSAVMAGTIRGREYRDYTVRAAAGQRMRINLATRSTSTYFNLLPPGSKDVATYVGSINGNSYDGQLDRSGPWTIRVYQMRNVARRGAVANYRLTVAISGRGGGDAMVPGTGFNATAMIRCVAEPSKPMRSCNAGVRRTGNGSGTVHITTPDGGSRVITFQGGRAVSSDSQAGMYTERRGDTSVVRIGTAEIYEIPDAFILGG